LMGTTFNKEQRRAIESTNQAILVAAGAGSGKSTVLVERLMRKIVGEQQANVDEFLVVTFTDLAAKEMAEKLRISLNKALANHPSCVHLQQQLYQLSSARISTFHGFCKEVLQRYYYLVELDANLQVMDAIDADLMMVEVLEGFMDDMYGDEDFNLLSDMFGSDRSDAPLAELLLNVYERARAHPEMDDWLSSLQGLYQVNGNQVDDWIHYATLKQLIIPLLEGAKGHVLQACEMAERISESHGYLETYQADLALIDAINEQLETGTYDDVKQLLNGTKMAPFPRKKKEWDEGLHKAAGKMRDQFKAVLKKISEDFFVYRHESHLQHFSRGAHVVTILAHVIQLFHARFSAEKLAISKVDFSDLERLTLKILREHPSALHEVASYFKEIMIDEYQDTNGMQERIVTLIADSGQCPMFMVGDVKQSIYRFRLADPTIFQKKYADYKKKETMGEKIDLMQNYRSSRDVIEGVNYIFQRIMDVTVGEISYDKDAELQLGLDEASHAFNQPELYVIDAASVVEDQVEKQLLQTPQLEAHFIAKKIRTMVDEEMKIWDRKAAVYRPITYKDMVILLRTMSASIDFYEILSSYGIPVLIESTGNLLQETEVITVLSALKMIDNPYQDIPLVAVMRSPLFFFTEPELAEIRLGAPEQTFYESVKQFENSHSGTNLQLKVAHFLTKLKKWRYQSKNGTVARLLRIIYEETSYYQFVLGIAEGQLKRANLDLLEATAKTYEKQSFKGLYGFLNYLNQLEKRGKMIPKATVSSSSAGVKIMTIHKSKGLEFPIVFVASIQKQFNTQDEMGNYIIHKDFLGVQYIDPILRFKQKTLATSFLIKKIHHEMLAEEMRLLYVALTRAQSKLILTGVLKDHDTILQLASVDVKPIHVRLAAKRYMDWVLPVVNEQGNNPWNWEIVTEIDIQPDQEKTSHPVFRQAPDIDFTAIFDKKYKHAALTQIVAKQSVTQRKVEETVPLYQGIAERLPKPAYDRPSFIKKDVKATEIGTAFHQFMQHLPIKADHTFKSLNELKAELISRHVIHAKLADKVNLRDILGFTKSDLYRQLLTANRIQKELPFTMLFNAGETGETIQSKAMLQGIVDLLAEFEEEVWIVDYKTDQVNHFLRDEPELRRRYEIQMKYYLQALRDIYPRKKVLAKVYFMRASEMIEYG